MNEFNAKQFYGYSSQNDPALATTTKNFEFRYMRPEFLERAIQRVHKERNIAEKNEPELVQHFCPHRSTATKQESTQGAPYKDSVVNDSHLPNKNTQFVRDLSEEEIESLIAKVKSFVQTLPRTSKICQSLQSPREGNRAVFDQPGQHSPNTTHKDNRDCTRTTTSEKRTGIFRQFSEDKTYDQQRDGQCSPKIVSQQYGRSNFVSTATSPLMSPRSGNDGKLKSIRASSTSPRNYPQVNLVSTATSPLTSPRRVTCGILRKLSEGDTPDLNKTYNLGAGNTNLTKNTTFHTVDYMDISNNPPQVPLVVDNVRMEEYQRPQAKWVEISETTKEIRVEKKVKDKRKKSTLLKSSRPGTPQNYESYSKIEDSPRSSGNQQLQMQHFMPTLLMTEVIKDNIRQAGGCLNVSPHEGYQDSVETVLLEDSDMEFEITQRPHYTKYIKSKPMPEEMLSLSGDDEGGLAEFLEIESGMNELDVRYLRNASPLSFTEMTEDETTQNSNQLKIIINDKHNQPILRSSYPNEIPEPHFNLSTPERCSSPSHSVKDTKRRGKTLREQHLQRTFERLARRGSPRDAPPCPSNSTSDQFQQQSARSCRARTNYSSSPLASRNAMGSFTDRGGVHPKKDKPKSSSRRQVLPINLKISKSIEDQKSEKTYIFQKMADNQVKIIQVLDKLKISLLELNVPKNVFEKSKRQKNALEFAVRFSRNFLYPLKGLLEELKFTPLEQFNSLGSNDACHRVCYIYNLLLQSLTTYQKQLRYFHLDHVPQKLPTLIEIIHTTTVLCLEKNIFSPQDERISFMQQSCNKFLDFLQELQDGHLNTARENYRKLTLEKASPKYELKMVMNPLNMYEAQLVAKVRSNNTTTTTATSTTARKKTKTKRHIASVAIDETKDDINEKPQDDQIPTHVQSYPVEAKSSECLQTATTHQLDLGAGDGGIPGIDQSVLQAMRHMTQEQVRTILAPILKTLSSALGQQNNPEMFEAIFNAFNSKVFSPLEAEKQLNSDNKCSPENQTAMEQTATATTTTTTTTASTTQETALRSRQAFGDVESTCKPLKVANRTKTPRQQNSRPTLATNKKNSANAITTTTATSNVAAIAAAAAAAAAVIVGDDDDGDGDDDDDSPTAIHTRNISNNNDSNNNNNNNNTNDHMKINANSLRHRIGNNNTNNNRLHSTGPDWRAANEGELTHKPNGGELTTMTSLVINREESQLNKTFKLMNEVVNEGSTDEKLPADHKKQHQQQQQQQHQYTTDNHPTNKSQILRTPKRAPKQDRDRLRRSRQQQTLNKFPCSSSSSHSSFSDDDDKQPSHQQPRSKKLNTLKFSKHQLQTHQSHHSSNNSILTTNKHDGLTLNSSQCQLQTDTVKRNLSKLSSRKTLTHPQKRNPLLATTPPAPTVTPSSSRGLLLSSNIGGSEENLDHLLLLNMPMDSIKMQIPLTSSASALMTGRRSDKQGGDTNYKISRSVSGDDYGGEFKKNTPLYTHNSPYDNTPDNTPQRLRPLPEKEMRKLKPKPKFDTAEIRHSFANETQGQRKNKFDTKPDLHIDEMIQERDSFLKLCQKNRFYKNPNFAEPWKIFSVISERLLNDMLDTVETDFNDGVSKFVEDFLELETKTQ